MGQPASNVLDAFKDLVPPLPDLTTGAFRPGRPHRDAATCARYRRRYAGTNDSVTWSRPPMAPWSNICSADKDDTSWSGSNSSR